MPPLTARQTRAERLADERERIKARDEQLIAEVNNRTDANYTEAELEMRNQYRTRMTEIDLELGDIAEDFEREEKAEVASKKLRGHLAAHAPGVDLDGDEIVYRTFAAYARDKLIDSVPEIREHVERELGQQFVTDAHERLVRAKTLYRAPEHTLSSHVDGLTPPQHIAQILDVINRNRPVVQSARQVGLTTGKLQWPKITQRPTVRPQGTEKTETLSRRMIVEMEEASANTYLGAGNLSWQTVQWSTPSGLELFFDLLAEDYAYQTEAEACHTLAKAAATIGSGSLSGSASDTFEDWLAAILAGFVQVYEDSGFRVIPNTVWVSPDMFVLAAGLVSDSRTVMIDTGSLNLPGLTGRMAGLNVVSSPGFVAGTAIVGDRNALLVGETEGAPVRMQVIEPSIGGYEVGVIGAFKSVSFDDTRFADIGSAT